MKIAPGNIAGVELIGQDEGSFPDAVEALYGRAPDAVLRPALPFSVVAVNRTQRVVALLGVRFDMLNPKAKAYSVVHYADTLRHPEKAALQPGAMRLVCAEPLYTDLVLRRASEVHARGPMNLETLRKALQVRASVDCVAFGDGEFAGPDSLAAFDRFEVERQAELAFIAEVLAAGSSADRIIAKEVDAAPATTRDRALLARKFLARRLHETLETGGADAALEGARKHRVRIKLWRREG